MAPAGAELLRQLPGRALWVERGAEGSRVVKVWRAPGALGRCFDRARARAEWRGLERARELGFPVPEPLSLGRWCGHWRLEMSYLEGTRSLAEVEPEDPGSVAAYAAAARLVAELQRAGARMGDLHPGNLLVDRAGRAFAVDFGKTRFGLPDLGPRLRREVVRLLGECRERVPARHLLAAARAWWRALDAEQRTGLGPRRALFAAVAAEARLDRRRRVLRESDRWCRRSECVRIGANGAWVRADQSAERELALAEALARADSGALLHFDDASYVALHAPSRGERRRLLAHWLAAGRLCDHAVPSARPALALGVDPVPKAERRAAFFELPPGAEPLEAAGGREEGRALEQALLDRGLCALPPNAALSPLWDGKSAGPCLLAGDLGLVPWAAGRPMPASPPPCGT